MTTSTAATPARINRARPALRISAWLQFTYPLVAFTTPRLKPPNNQPKRPFDSFLGLSRSAESAGESVNALKAEISTAMAMVNANCSLSRP